MSSTTQTTPSENLAMVKRFIYELQEQAHYELIDQFFHPEFINYTPAPSLGNDRASVLAQLKQLHAMFKDIKMEIVSCVAQENTVATHKILRGRVNLPDGQGDGGRMEVRIMDFVTFEGGLVREHWSLSERRVVDG